MNKKQARRHNREVKRRRGFKKLASKHLVTYAQEAFNELVDKIKAELP